MAIDNNHITKLGELKQLIDGLWGKVTTAISNAVSGLLSKSEAAETYATKGEIPTVPTNVSAFENDVGYITEAEVPQYELTADKIAAVGELSNNTSGSAKSSKSLKDSLKYSGSTSVYGIYLGDLTSSGQYTWACATYLIEISDVANYRSMQYLARIERRGSGQFRAVLSELGAHNIWDKSINVILAYVNKKDNTSTESGLSSWYILFKDKSDDAFKSKNYVRFSAVRVFNTEDNFVESFTFVTNTMSYTGSASARISATYAENTTGTGSSNKPVYVSSSGTVTACGFGAQFVASLPSYSSMEDGVLYVL